MGQLRCVFDVVRLVDPEKMQVLDDGAGGSTLGCSYPQCHATFLQEADTIQKGHFVMNLKELYACCGGDFDTVMDIWRSDERVARFLGRFLEDGSYANFHKFLDAGNLPEAFRAVHTLKGVCLNLCLTRLSESSATVTDALRGGADHTTPAMLARFDADYAQVTQSIRTYLAERQV